MLTIEQNVLLIYQNLFIKRSKKNKKKNKEINGNKGSKLQN